ncbi:MAG: SDR family NAD(P)-dependent oxidoreductase [Firmicutes bacterium]|nr:SDR family NAD(P)-dependent oxidoreductase [Bacillota bacterium]
MINKTPAETKVFITGASSGIGAATALLLAQKGYQVWGTTRDLAKVKKLPVELQTKVKFIKLDLTDDASAKQGVAEFLSQSGGEVDILINNAGCNVFGPVEEYSLEKAKEIFNLNYFGPLRLIQALVPFMREKRSGLIINVSSLAGIFVIPFQVQYSATKFSLEALTEGLRQELRPFGVKVVAVEPGDIKTLTNENTVFDMKPDTPYKKWANRCWKTIEDNLEKAPGPSVVAHTIYRIIQKRNPRTRYTSGDPLSRAFPAINRFVSSRVKEFLIRVFYNI